ncbi:MAG: hypothetical protein VB858_17935, partial [Planctomycetaceae bacterium]
MTGDKNREAQQLLSRAREAMSRGLFDTARKLAIEAGSRNATYSLFDETPEVVLSDIARAESRTGNGPKVVEFPAQNSDPEFQLTGGPNPASTLAGTGTGTRPLNKPGQVRPLNPPSQSPELPVLQSAPPQLPRTNPVAVTQPQPGSVEQPAAVNPVDGNSTIKPVPGVTGPVAQSGSASRSPAAAVPNEDMRRQAAAASELLQEARQLLVAGKLLDARAKALAARQLGVIFGLFDDNPEEVLAAIAEREAAASRTTPAPGFRNRALLMMQAARQDIASGNLDAATAKALTVREMDLTFGALEDRPELILTDIDRARTVDSLPVADTQAPASEPVAVPPAESTPTGQPVAGTGTPRPLPLDVVRPAVGSFTGNEGDNITTIHPTGLTAATLFQQGRSFLKQGNREAAYQAFLEAWQSGQKLDAYQTQELQNYLRELSPRRSGIQLASGESQGQSVDSGRRPIDVAEERDLLKFDRLRSEVLNTMLRADRLRESRPDEAMEMLDSTLAAVENSGFEEQRIAGMIRQLQRSQSSIEGYA